MSKELLEERGHEYGRAWYLESVVKNLLNDYHTNEREIRVFYSAYLGPWDAILAKMMRLAETPDHVDSWADIEGYARLARRHIEDGVWHGEEPREKVEFTAQCNRTNSSNYYEYEVEPILAAKASSKAQTVVGMVMEDCKAGDIVVIAQQVEMEE